MDAVAAACSKSHHLLLFIMKNKYGAKKQQYQGMTFDSKGELARYIQLETLQRAGHIKNLERQIPLHIEHNGIKICKYIADFCYQENDLIVYEDFKGVETDVFKLKKKLVKAFFNIDILVTKKITQKKKEVLKP